MYAIRAEKGSSHTPGAFGKSCVRSRKGKGRVMRTAQGRIGAAANARRATVNRMRMLQLLPSERGGVAYRSEISYLAVCESRWQTAVLGDALAGYSGERRSAATLGERTPTSTDGKETEVSVQRHRHLRTGVVPRNRSPRVSNSQNGPLNAARQTMRGAARESRSPSR